MLKQILLNNLIEKVCKIKERYEEFGTGKFWVQLEFKQDISYLFIMANFYEIFVKFLLKIYINEHIKVQKNIKACL